MCARLAIKWVTVRVTVTVTVRVQVRLQARLQVRVQVRFTVKTPCSTNHTGKSAFVLLLPPLPLKPVNR